MYPYSNVGAMKTHPALELRYI